LRIFPFQLHRTPHPFLDCALRESDPTLERPQIRFSGYRVLPGLGDTVLVTQQICQNDPVNKGILEITLAGILTLASRADRAATTSGSNGDRQGRIEGIVLYESGIPVKGATVSALPLDRVLAGIVPHADTDDFGRFQIGHLWLGKFAVTAKKEAEAYPDVGKGFYYDGKIAPTTLSFSHLSTTMSIILGPKAGVLVGTVTDAVTASLLNPCIDFHRASNPNNFLSGTGLVNAHYRVLVPSNREVVMKIWKEGYLPWYYPGANNKSGARPLNLKPGEEKTLNIRLQPGNDPSDAGCNTSLCFPHCRP